MCESVGLRMLMPPHEHAKAGVLPSAGMRSLTWRPNFTARKLTCLTSCSTLTYHFLPKRQLRKKKKHGGGAQTEGGRGKKKREEEKWGAGGLLLLLSPYLFPLSLYFFSFWLSKGETRWPVLCHVEPPAGPLQSLPGEAFSAFGRSHVEDHQSGFTSERQQR